MRVSWTKAGLVSAIAVATIYDLLVAFVFLLVLAHYDGTHRGTITLLLAIAAGSAGIPLTVCFYPFRLSLPWRLGITVLVGLIGTLIAVTHG